MQNPMTNTKSKNPSLGPNPTMLSRKEVDALYETFDAVRKALDILNVEYIVTGGSLLGAIRQHSILFCDDDSDIAILDYRCTSVGKDADDIVSTSTTSSANTISTIGKSNYTKVLEELSNILGDEYLYNPNAWEGGGQVRPKRMSNIFLDLFVLREYHNSTELMQVIGMKKNGLPQSKEYVQTIIDSLHHSLSQSIHLLQLSDEQNEKDQIPQHEQAVQSHDLSFPFWHFATRKAIEMWPKEVYRTFELFPIQKDLSFGPLTNICGPRMPVLLLKRAFGSDCFHVYYESQSHHQPKDTNRTTIHHTWSNKTALETMSSTISSMTDTTTSSSCSSGTTTTSVTSLDSTPVPSPPLLQPIVANGGVWTTSQKKYLQDEHYIPMQPLLTSKRRHSFHNRERLMEYIVLQSEKEASWWKNDCCVKHITPLPSSALDPSSSSSVLSSFLEIRIVAPFDQGPLHQPRKLYTRILHPPFLTSTTPTRPHCTVYMDGVFDMLHIGHLNAIQEASKLGHRLIIGITGQEDATSYKRAPIIPQEERIALIASISLVDAVICPCPLIVTEEFMMEHEIDLVVHGFANEDDAKKQEEFFKIPQRLNRFQRIPYYSGTSTTQILERILQSSSSHPS